jgi:hypothetical protein
MAGYDFIRPTGGMEAGLAPPEDKGRSALPVGRSEIDGPSTAIALLEHF